MAFKATQIAEEIDNVGNRQCFPPLWSVGQNKIILKPLNKKGPHSPVHVL